MIPAGGEHGGREAMRMLFLTLFILTVGVICVLAVWPLFEDARARKRRPRTSTADPQPDCPPVARPQSLEGVLMAQLVAGEISGSQYRRAVEGLAARDEERHPMAVPPEFGSADA
jgi:hypothetical protein